MELTSMPVQVLYNAQMIRTWSLLLRNAQRLGYIVSGRQVSRISADYQLCISINLCCTTLLCCMSSFLEEGVIQVIYDS